jgi:hypothetical protein
MLWLLSRLAGPPESKTRKLLIITAQECAIGRWIRLWPNVWASANARHEILARCADIIRRHHPHPPELPSE